MVYAVDTVKPLEANLFLVILAIEKTTDLRGWTSAADLPASSRTSRGQADISLCFFLTSSKASVTATE